MNRPACRLTFPNGRGDTLCGQLDLPDGEETRAYALFAHCFTCSKQYKAAAYTGRALREFGVATLRFDFTGLGDSGGDFSATNLSTQVEDVLAAVDYLSREYEAPGALIGHSMGGAAALLAAGYLQSARVLATIATPSQPGKLGRRLRRTRQQAEEEGEGKLKVAGKEYTLPLSFFEDLEKHDLEPAVGSLETPYIVAHDPEDDTVPFENAQALMGWAGQPKTLLTLKGAGHLLSEPSHARKLAKAVAARLFEGDGRGELSAKRT